MSDKDTVTKEFMRDTKVFADVFNLLLYDGKQVINPSRLQEKDTAKQKRAKRSNPDRKSVPANICPVFTETTGFFP